MARIPDAHLEPLVTGFGVELKRHGIELIRRCPLHEDKTPPLLVSPKTNLWHCPNALRNQRFSSPEVYVDALRTRRRLRAWAAVGKAGIKMLFPIVIFILPVLFVITLVPGMLSVLHDLETLRGGK